MKKHPLGFIVTCSNNPSQRPPFKVKIYALMKTKRFDVVRFRLFKQFGEFHEHHLAAEAASEYAKLHELPYVWSKALHNHAAPRIMYSWYFKNPPIKFLESVFDD